MDIITDALDPVRFCIQGCTLGLRGINHSKLPREAVRSLFACLHWVILGDYVGITLLLGIGKKTGSIKADLVF